MSKTRFMLIDGNSLLYRAFYALPLLHNREGIYTNGVYGFLTMLNRVLSEQNPTHILVAFDKDKKTFRTEMFTQYKANRATAPDELQGQFGLLREVLTALNIDYLELQGYEADDIIGTLSKKAEEDGIETVIVTGDSDTLQLVSDTTAVMMTRKGITEIDHYDTAAVKKRYEVDPPGLIEIKALMGDASDNIPGVPGVGIKTATKLIKEYGTLENLYKNLAQVSGKKLVERLQENRELAFLSRELGTIIRDIDIPCNLEDYQVKEPDYHNLRQLYQRLEFSSLLQALEQQGVDTGEEYVEKEIPVVKLGSEEITAEFIASIEDQQEVALLVKADYHHPMWAKLQDIYLEKGKTVYHLEIGEKSLYRLEWLRPLLEKGSIKKYLHNAKFAQVLLKRYGVELDGIKGDTMLAAYVDDPTFAGEELAAVLAKYLTISIDPADPVLLTAHIRSLYEAIYQGLSDQQRDLLQQVELPLSSVLSEMQFTGVKVERDTLSIIAEELETGIHNSEQRIFELAGQEFNINSPKQLGKVLFEDLGLPVIKKTKTGYATGAEILEELFEEHEIISYILYYRQVTKLKSTYVDALQELIHPDTGRVHTILKQAQTATGRLSSVEPNLQNIPIKDEEGRRIRKAFTTSGEEWIMVSADYSQIDLRSLAHISGDETLIATFKEGIDIHTRTASEIFKVDLADVTPELRRRAKAVNFGIIYGISDFGLSRDTGVSRKEARRYIDSYLDSYPGVRRYMEDIVTFGREHGYVETILKRRRYLPDLNARNKMTQSFARRMALNTPIQGTSADIIKLAMIKVSQELKKYDLKAKLLLQVHDDMILEVHRDEVDQVCGILKDCMENACQLRVPLEVSIKTGPNWNDMKDYR
ncbi:DNA polymerase I [Syntrophomonas erecta]